MVLLFFVVLEVEAGETAAWAADLENREEMECLDEEEEPEFAVVEFAHTATDPEAVVVEFTDATAAVFTMAGAEWHHKLAFIAEPSFR